MITDLKTAAAYIRVSTDNQTELSPDSQIKVVREYAKQHGYIIPKEFIFRDDGISGRHADKRPAFNNMIATAKQKPSPFAAVLLWKFSRFARNQEQSIFYKSMLRKNGVEVLSVSEPVIDGPFGTLIERIIEWSDEYYSIRLSGEVRRGMTERVERGGAVSVPAFGYSISDKQYVVNPETAPIVRRIFSDYLGGVPCTRIARNLNLLGVRTTRGNAWENRTVEYVLQNPVYIGKIRWNPKRRTQRNYDDPDIMVVDGSHEPIIDTSVFEQVQELIARNRKKHRKHVHEVNREDYMLHGLVKCSNCGRTLALAVKGVSLQCVGYTHGKCSVSHSITLAKINAAVIDAIEESFRTGNFHLIIKRDTPGTEEAEPDIDKLIEKEQQKLRRIREAYEDGIYTLEELKESRAVINAHIDALKGQRKTEPPKLDELKKRFAEKHKDVVKVLRDPLISEAEKNSILRDVIDKIVFSRSDCTIKLSFYC